MSGLLRTICVLAVAAIFSFSALAGSTQENRSAHMKQIWKNFKPFTLVAKGEAEPSMGLVGNAAALQQLSKGLLVLFPQGSGGGKSRAKPEIWSDWAGFQKAVANFQAAAPGLVPAAKSGDAGKIKAATGAVGKACGGCHKPYRAPKKKK